MVFATILEGVSKEVERVNCTSFETFMPTQMSFYLKDLLYL